MAIKSKFDGLAAALGMIGGDHKGVRRDDQILGAVRAADKLLKTHDLRWVDVGQALVQRDEAERRASDLYDAALQLQRERDQARAELQRLREANGHGGTLAAALWQDTTLPRTIENKHAEWLLAVGIYLSPKERRFVESCARWRGPLTPNQRPWLGDLVRRAIARTRQTPPS
jgi:hypothetical protein